MSPKHRDDKNYYLYNQYGDNPMPPVGPIALITLNVDPEFAGSVNYFLRNRRAIYLSKHPELSQTPGFMRIDYRIPVSAPRFTSGEGKAIIEQSVRGHDLFIITDVLNHSSTYRRFGEEVSMGPDDHYQDLIRIILAVSGHARRINLIMPYLYEGRQDRRTSRESLDCAAMLRQLYNYNVSNIFTFDAHDSRVSNAIPLGGFENLPTSYQIIESLIRSVNDLKLDADHTMVVSPDEGGINRAIYYASMLEVPLGTYYKKIDYQKKISGDYQTVDKKFLGDDVSGKDILIIDDMIVTGKTMLKAAYDLKSRGASRIFGIASFAQFTEGLSGFNAAYSEGVISNIIATNLIYRSDELQQAPWFIEANMARYVSLLIDAVNHDASLSKLISPTTKINKLLEFYKNRPNN
ncbi:MAG: ribose-phosphate pyrophosphokinase [Eubacteriales bacterium]|nr:ribose-phosphate pyrophosphokinase [Eubacteriales bacterium]MDD3197523.1 ribose-phosphate pyrophosphokinase [Eubacteriales bacterium]MDD3502472.1 ribose-phosphate pyrophosphokinase [Eubacteriales bacterium]MDD4682149.1 ribose-phosphate pyrophosphokinase [Eubacteriales bacterium]